MSANLFEAAAERAVKTWKAYLAALCLLLLAFVIDRMSGSPFFEKGEPIEIANFKVIREALSATYGILFAVFVGAAYQESCLLKRCVKESANSSVARPEAIELWFISPFSPSVWMRRLFALSVVYGFGLLGLFSVIHLIGWRQPAQGPMADCAYQAIGVFDALVFGCCLWPAFRTYRNLQEVRAKLAPGISDV